MRKAVFFDVDDTLIHCKSMFSFLEFYLHHTEKKINDLYYQDIIDNIQHKVSNGWNRLDVNTFYYNLFRGEQQSLVKKYAKLFFLHKKETIFKKKILNRLTFYKESGYDITFVSGSMVDILQPIADYLGVTTLLCAIPEVIDGQYTGMLQQQAIGDQKASLVRSYAAKNSIDLKESVAFGDHISDKPMLNLVGHAYVVDPVASFRKEAIRKGWVIL